MTKLTTMCPARAFISVLSFPRDLETLDSYLGPDRRGEKTFVDEILAGDGESWTAPRWADRGDVCFFYYSKRAVENIKRLSRLAERGWDSEAGLPEYFAHALEQAQSLSGKIFAYAFVSGPAFYERPPKGEPRHWRIRSYAPIGEPHVLTQPLDLIDNSDVLPVPCGQSTISLSAGEFEALRERLVRGGNEIAAGLRKLIPHTESFYPPPAHRWRELTCHQGQRFASEKEIRGALIDPLLSEVKDPGTQVHREAWCWRSAGLRARADYLIQLGGTIIPVEAKLNILTEADLQGQINQYLAVTRMTVGYGRQQLPVDGKKGDVCLVIDQRGIFAIDEGGFVGCTSRRPVIARTALMDLSGDEIRQRLLLLVTRKLTKYKA